MVPHAGGRVCAACKPAFLQRLQEGVAVVGTRYAGFWIRLGAALIDGVILWVVNTLLSLTGMAGVVGLAGPESDPGAMLAAAGLLWLVQVAIGASYETWFVGRFGATPGKLALRLRVVTSDGGRVSYARALARYFAKFLSAIILMIGYLLAAFDREKRALHDMICDTRVLRA